MFGFAIYCSLESKDHRHRDGFTSTDTTQRTECGGGGCLTSTTVRDSQGASQCDRARCGDRRTRNRQEAWHSGRHRSDCTGTRTAGRVNGLVGPLLFETLVNVSEPCGTATEAVDRLLAMSLRTLSKLLFGL